MSAVEEAATLHKIAQFKNADATQGRGRWASLLSWGTLCGYELTACRQSGSKSHDLTLLLFRGEAL
ncbi:MAG: hypothetical protein CMP97_10025 [Gammaproteobacteria bacterium]|nr:hypothetical protein [Gammaproteobacteria bacterium]